MTSTSPNLNSSNVGFSALQVQCLRNSFVEAGGTNEIDTLNLGASGTAGTLNVYPTTAAKGKIKLSATDNTADYQVAITNAAYGQASTLTIPDVGNATGAFVMDKGTSTISGSKTLTGTTQINTLNLGASGTAGTQTIYPATAANGTFVLSATNNASNFAATLTNAAIGQATVYTLPDPGAATDNIATLKTANVFTAAQQINTLNVGASGTVGSLNLFSTTASKGKWNFAPVDNTGNTTMTITNTAQGGAYTYTIPDSVGAASFVMQNSGTGTESSNAVTISKLSGVITTSSLNTAGGGSFLVTLTNTYIAATSKVFATYNGGTNTTRNITIGCVPGSGSAAITIYNNTAATALNGTVIIDFFVIP